MDTTIICIEYLNMATSTIIDLKSNIDTWPGENDTSFHLLISEREIYVYIRQSGGPYEVFVLLILRLLQQSLLS